jgi:hypothetical protein
MCSSNQHPNAGSSFNEVPTAWLSYADDTDPRIKLSVYKGIMFQIQDHHRNHPQCKFNTKIKEDTVTCTGM